MEAKENLEKTIEEVTTEEVVTPQVEAVEEVVTTEVEQPVVPEPAKDEAVFVNKPAKKGSGMAIGMVLLALLAIAGIGFGVWTMMDKDQQVKSLNDQITSLKSQNDTLQEQVIQLQEQIDNASATDVVEDEVDCLVTPDAAACSETTVEETTPDTTEPTTDTTTDTTTNTTVTE